MFFQNMADFFCNVVYNVLLNSTLHLTIESNLKNILFCFFGSIALHFISFYKILYLDYLCVCVCV